MNTHTPRQAVSALRAHRTLDDDNGDRFAGYGIMGIPFSSGHYLALRDMVASSVGPPYRSIWHRDPQSQWTIHTSVDPDRSCPRYFGAGAVVDRQPIDVSWTGDHEFEVTLGDTIRWRLVLTPSPATRLMSSMGSALPAAAWDDNALLKSMGPMASTLLGAGRIRLCGTTPNSQWFQAQPRVVYRVASSTATIGGIDIGTPAGLHRQIRLGDLWLPQRGVFFVGTARFTPDWAAATGKTARREPAVTR
ncbi:hypothetical protein AAFP30_04175 [Gordonia sp. CPCC 205515]|uniref:hypothetical protein n=1 Tax=Gordonia sp. CPCC 205515 TaxID=3140791 RepID=UPI003AF37E99